MLAHALTHKSLVNEVRGHVRQDNERLEFLGDAVLALIVSQYLTDRFPDCTEGELSRLKARLVSEPTLAEAARRLRLGTLLRLGKGEELTKGREKSSLLADALEAVIAAIYLDGGLEAARGFTVRALAGELQELDGAAAPSLCQDDKTRLQEWCQKRYETLPQYRTVRESGPDHRKIFEVQLLVRGEPIGVGTGPTKKEAEQMAAKRALERLQGEDQLQDALRRMRESV